MQKTKKEIIFWIFMKRIFVFLVIVFCLIIVMNFVLKWLSADLFFYNFFWIDQKQYVIKKDLSKSNNFEEAKQWTLYVILNDLLKKNRVSQKDQTLTEFQFSLLDIKKSYEELKNSIQSSTQMIWSNFNEMETLINKYSLFSSFNIFDNQKSFKAKKIFYIEMNWSSYVLDISNQWNQSYWVKIYRAINSDWLDDTKSKVFSNFSMRVKFEWKKKKILYLKSKNWTEKAFFTYNNWKYTYSWVWWLTLQKEKTFYQNILTFFTDVDKYLKDDKRNTFIIKYLKTKSDTDKI